MKKTWSTPFGLPAVLLLCACAAAAATMLLGIRPARLPQDASLLALSAVAWLCLFAAIVAAARRMQEQEAIVAAAKKKEQEMELAYVSAPDGLAMLDADLRYVRINKHLADINGFSIDAHIGKSIHEMVPEIAEQAEAPFRQVLATGKPILGIEFQGSVISQPEVLHVWRENVYPIFDSHGKVIGLNIVAEEVTEQKRLHDALQASELRERQRATELDTIMNATPATIWIARDKACTHITGNPESYRMLRLVPGENASASAPEDVLRSRPFPQIADRDGKALAPEQLPRPAESRARSPPSRTLRRKSAPSRPCRRKAGARMNSSPCSRMNCAIRWRRFRPAWI